MKKGFTLIELLIVIAILGVLVGVVVLALNPAAKINKANDATIKVNVNAIANALQIYASSGFYPSNSTELIAGGEIGVIPTTPTGVTYTMVAQTAAGGACTLALQNCAKVSVASSKLFAPVTAGYTWCWKSAVGTGAESATVAACTP